MKKHGLVLAASAFVLAFSAIGVSAQESHGMRGDECHGMMGHGGGIMGRGAAMRLIFALMDSDGDGTVSLQEFQAAHEKIFKAMDTDKDGTLPSCEGRVNRLGRKTNPNTSRETTA
jgi:hypothetical protein